MVPISELAIHSFILAVVSGGSCFPKDVNALIKTANSVGYNPELIAAVDGVNQRQKQVIVQKIITRFGEDLSGKNFALWGLSFKPETDDMRDAPSLVVVNELTKEVQKFLPMTQKL